MDLDKLIDDNVTDENKHQYMSCLAGKGGKLEATVGWTVGLGKEVIDVDVIFNTFCVIGYLFVAIYVIFAVLVFANKFPEKI